MTHLRQMLQRPNYSPHTVRSYIHAVEEFVRYAKVSFMIAQLSRSNPSPGIFTRRDVGRTASPRNLLISRN